MYTAQNIDKRFPPPFSIYERRALARVSGLYPCSRQARVGSARQGVLGTDRGDSARIRSGSVWPGEQSLADSELVLGLFGRLVPEKGVRDAVSILERVNSVRPARLLLAGSGPEASTAFAFAAELGLGDRVDLHEWLSTEDVAERYRRCHVVLVPSRVTPTWAEQSVGSSSRRRRPAPSWPATRAGRFPRWGRSGDRRARGTGRLARERGSGGDRRYGGVVRGAGASAWNWRLPEPGIEWPPGRSTSMGGSWRTRRRAAVASRASCPSRGRSPGVRRYGGDAGGRQVVRLWPLRSGGRLAAMLGGAIDLPD